MEINVPPMSLAAGLARVMARPERGERPERVEAERPDRSERDRSERDRPAAPPRDFERDRAPMARGRERDRDDYRRRDRDDLGPAVRGFGDAVPAFMLIPIRRFRRDPAADQEQEAA